MKVGPEKTTLNIFPDTSSVKCELTMTFNQFKEYNVRNNFLQKLCRK